MYITKVGFPAVTNPATDYIYDFTVPNASRFMHSVGLTVSEEKA
jgi:hypothetical protein